MVVDTYMNCQITTRTTFWSVSYFFSRLFNHFSILDSTGKKSFKKCEKFEISKKKLFFKIFLNLILNDSTSCQLFNKVPLTFFRPLVHLIQFFEIYTL